MESGIWFFMLLLFFWVQQRTESDYRPAILEEGDTTQRRRLPGAVPGGFLERVWVEQGARVGQRTGIKVHAALEVRRSRGECLDYAVTFSTPGGVRIRSRASRYRNASGWVEGRARTKPLKHDPSRFRDLWVFLPYGAFDVAPGVTPLVLNLEVEVDGTVVARSREAFSFVQPEGGPETAPALPADALRIEGVARGDEVGCGVCNEPVAGRAYVCEGCDSLHHLDCWDYNQGCATYGCGVKAAKA